MNAWSAAAAAAAAASASSWLVSESAADAALPAKTVVAATTQIAVAAESARFNCMKVLPSWAPLRTLVPKLAVRALREQVWARGILHTCDDCWVTDETPQDK